MNLPPLVIAQAENHPCFSGVYTSGNEIVASVAPQGALLNIIDVQCNDCLFFRLGIDTTLLPPGTSTYQVARELSAHMRAHRGYDFSLSGYHAQGSGFWLSAAYWAQHGLFFLGNTRGSSNGKPPLDVLFEAIQTGLVANLHPNLTDRSQYICHDVYLSVVPPAAPMSMASLLNSCHVSSQKKPNYVPVTLAEFQPIATQNLTAQPPAAIQPPPGPSLAIPAPSLLPSPLPSSTQASSKASSQNSRQPGTTCEVCGEVIGERWLFSSTYIGCKCG
jgi:hypothetical protein